MKIMKENWQAKIAFAFYI